jgi:hypothetical protein
LSDDNRDTFPRRVSAIRQVGRVYHHLKLDDTTGAVAEDWFVAIPQIRVCR